MQFFGQGKPPVGIIFDAAIGRKIDDALALALLFGLDGKNEARALAFSVSYPNLKAAAFCEIVKQFYASGTTGTLVKFLTGYPIGLLEAKKPAVDTPMLTATLDRKKPDGSPVYPTTIHQMNDTAIDSALIRNVLTAQQDQNAIVVCTGPLTNLAAVLKLTGVKDLISQKVRYLAIAGGSFAGSPPEINIKTDIAAAKAVFAEWPSPIVVAGEEIGRAVPYPAASIEKDFTWTDAHPIVDAYRAFKPMPYDAPTTAMSAVLYAIRPKEAYFKESDAGTISVTPDGRTQFTPSAKGTHRHLIFDPDKAKQLADTYTTLASAKPVQRVLNFRRPKKEEDKKDEKKPEVKQPESPKS